jgi:chromosome partitioning protein
MAGEAGERTRAEHRRRSRGGRAERVLRLDRRRRLATVPERDLAEPRVRDGGASHLARVAVVRRVAELAGAEVELVGVEDREKILKKALQEIKEDYDYIIIDCPPSLGMLTLNALTAADSVLIPIQCEFYALEGLGQLMNTIQMVQQQLNPDLYLEGVLLTMFDGRTNLAIQVVDEIKKHFREKVYRSIVPRNVRISEAPSHGKPVMLYDRRSRGAEAYHELAKEVMGIE